MRKLKNWLIKKLGGIPKDEIPTHHEPSRLLFEKIDMTPIYTRYVLEPIEMDMFKTESPAYCEALTEHIKKILTEMLLKEIAMQISPEFIERKDDVVFGGKHSMIAKIVIPSRYVKGK